MAANNPNPSQTSSHAPLEPIAGITLLHAELNRRASLPAPCATGCRELDDATLVSGGFERGCVVGISAEEDDVALVVGLQTIARLLLAAGGDAAEGAGGRRRRKGRVMVVTTMGVGSLVGLLREVLRAQGVSGRARETEVLGRVAVSRVFDVNGLWEVLGEVDSLGASQEVGEGMRMPEGDQEEEGGGRRRSSGMAHGGEDAAVRIGATAPPDCESKQAPHEEQFKNAEQNLQIRHVGDFPSSPLSDPPSSLPDTPPWEAIERAQLYTDKTDTGDAELSRRTPPGRREEIQDSEEEEGGFSSPLEPTKHTPESPPARSGKMTSSPIPQGAPEPDQNNILPLLHESSQGGHGSHSTTSAAEAVEVSKLDQEDLPSRQSISTTAQDNSVDIQPKANASEPDKPDEFPPKSRSKDESIHPDIVLITHMSTLLSSLFHQRDKAAAHHSLQLLASHLRYLTRSSEHGGPLIMVLNSTTSSETNVAAPAQDQDRDGPPRPPPPGGPPTPNRPLDPTLRSIFNPPPLPVSGLSYNYDTPHSRRNKPFFGLIFTQLLDLHLLCTKIPKTRADAEALYAPTSPRTSKVVEFVWAVEVLLDETGVWEGRENVLEGSPRRSREQRWGAVEVRRDGTGVRVVDAFENKAHAVPQEIVVSAGFGGRRV